MHVHGPVTGSRLKLAAALTALFVVGEFLAGWWANSLALISDAGHNLTDVAALLLSAWAFAMASRPPDTARSFGYHRVGVLAALANALTLVLLAGYILFEGYERLIQPEPVASLPMIAVAVVALVLNATIARSLHHGAHDVNVRAAFIHMVGDAVSSVGVILAGLLVLVTGSARWDPLVSLLIGLFILWSSWSIIRETIAILLESTPGGIDQPALIREVEAIPGVENIHDIHIWSLSSHVRALSAHIALADREATPGEIRHILADVRHILRERYGIDHMTLETHCGGEGLEGADLMAECDCALLPTLLAAGHHHEHEHHH